MIPRSFRSRRFLALSLLSSLALPVPAPAQAPTPQAEHVVLVVWSGLRPDQVSETLTPNLYRLAQEGTRFSRHHAVYPTTPLVNGVALLTGSYPGRSGLFADRAYFPALDPARPVATGSLAAVRLGDALTLGNYLNVQTLPELLQNGGFTTAVAGAGYVPLLADRQSEEARTSDAAASSPVVYTVPTAPPPGIAPGSLAELPLKTVTVPAALDKQLKPFPTAILVPNLAQDRWMTRALLDGLWKKDVPRFSLLWLSDPAVSQHDASPGATPTLVALHGQDENLRLVLKTLEMKGVRGKTDVFVVSDTGYSTIGESVDVAADLSKAGFNAVRKLKVEPKTDKTDKADAKAKGDDVPDPKNLSAPPVPATPALAPGKVLVVGNGGTVLLYVGGHDEEVTARLLAFFQRSRYAGVLFSREARDGAFTLHQARMATGDWESLPDLVLSMRWTAEANRYGVPGSAPSDVGMGGSRMGTGGTLSRFDLHATLIAAGPDIRAGWVDDLPTGNADLAPTIAGLLRLPSPPWMDGRVLVEAVRDFPSAPPTVEAETLDASAGSWRQSLRISKINGAVYFEEGNGQGNGRGGVGEP